MLLPFYNKKKIRTGDSDFDIPMGCYGGAEVDELMGIFILTKLSNIIDKHSIGLYHDDGFGVFDNFFRSQIEHRRKKIMKTFKDCGLSITITSNIKSVALSNVQKTKQRPAIY